MEESLICGTAGCTTIVVGLCFAITLILFYGWLYITLMQYWYKKYLDIDVSEEEILETKKQRKVRRVDTHPIFKDKV